MGSGGTVMAVSHCILPGRDVEAHEICKDMIASISLGMIPQDKARNLK